MYYVEKQKEIIVSDSVDVVVTGGGPAGIGAAIAAARMGASTILIEQTGDVGGVATTGLMSHWTGSTKGGLYDEIIERSGGTKTIDPEKLKNLLLTMLEEAGVKLRTYTFACDAIMTGNKICGVIIESKSGREAIYAKTVIDCSGDGDIAAKAGAEYQLGREEDGKMQPMTLMFKVGGVDESKGVFPGMFESNLPVPKGRIQDLAREHLTSPLGHVLLYKTTIKSVITCNMTNVIGYDGTNAEDLAKAHNHCRKQMDEIVPFLREFVPGFENCFVISSASVIGVRETRHFVGEKTITEDDIAQARVYDDWAVTKAHFNFDIHNIDGAGLDKNGCQAHFKQSNGYTIPYGCLVPIKIDGLLLAGRCISGTHKAHSSYRVMPICVNMGHAAGVAAAICAKEDILPRNVDINVLQGYLKKQGVDL